ncbi:MAG: tyrosine--tRNA ligase [Actinobacteria bacterium]|nr:tyrosine--tRNA ligase [Actinomycetota bacterium]|tara:strand:- start:67 stop:1242 length:1176 start_codon:yes stop_codon:yes gene_type:complete
MKYLEERATNIEPLSDYKEISKNKNLRIKLGIDPTAHDVTLGWYAILRMLRKYQESGHTAVLILGEFTAQVGDPSGKSDTRNRLEANEINDYSNSVLQIIKDILHKDNLEIVSNNDWLGSLTIHELLELTSSTTLAQMLERDDFANRFKSQSPISLIEFFYPLFQGYDSVATRADIEIGGTDQLWNLMIGREIQKFYNQKPQVAMTFPLLVGTDGTKKMSQSFNNYISITDSPENIYGNLMSIPDEAMWEYFKLLTDIPLKTISDYKNEMKAGKINPFELKKTLGLAILEELTDKKSAEEASYFFESTTVNKIIPESIPEIHVDKNIDLHLPKFLLDNHITKSNSEARRLIKSNSVKINDKSIEILDINSNDLIDKVLQVGKRRFYRIISK